MLFTCRSIGEYQYINTCLYGRRVICCAGSISANRVAKRIFKRKCRITTLYQRISCCRVTWILQGYRKITITRITILTCFLILKINFQVSILFFTTDTLSNINISGSWSHSFCGCICKCNKSTTSTVIASIVVVYPCYGYRPTGTRISSSSSMNTNKITCYILIGSSVSSIKLKCNCPCCCIGYVVSRTLPNRRKRHECKKHQQQSQFRNRQYIFNKTLLNCGAWVFNHFCNLWVSNCFHRG